MPKRPNCKLERDSNQWQCYCAYIPLPRSYQIQGKQAKWVFVPLEGRKKSLIIANLVTYDLIRPFGERSMSTDHFCLISLSIEKRSHRGMLSESHLIYGKWSVSSWVRCGISENYKSFYKERGLIQCTFFETQMICKVFSVILHLGVLLSTNFHRGFYFVVAFIFLFPSSRLEPLQRLLIKFGRKISAGEVIYISFFSR